MNHLLDIIYPTINTVWSSTPPIYVFHVLCHDGVFSHPYNTKQGIVSLPLYGITAKRFLVQDPAHVVLK
jgi:hypothetical protein